MRRIARWAWHLLPLPFRGGLYKRFHLSVLAFHRLVDDIFDKRYNVSTSKVLKYTEGETYDDPLTNDDPADYIPSAYLPLRKIISRFKPSPDDVVFDMGCGLGRSLFVFANAGVRQAIGVEFNKVLHQGYEKNIDSFTGPPGRCVAVHGDASKVNIDDATVIYMYNPFGAGTMRALARSIEDSLSRRKRRLSIIYWHPLCVDELQGLPGFRIVNRFVTKRKPVLFIEVGEGT